MWPWTTRAELRAALAERREKVRELTDESVRTEQQAVKREAVIDRLRIELGKARAEVAELRAATPEPCCHLHQPAGCCDAEDCKPCCMLCPTCPTLRDGKPLVLVRQRAAAKGVDR